jgi:hypothetical protein
VDSRIVGKWEEDKAAAATGDNKLIIIPAGSYIEFRSGGTFVDTSPNFTPITEGRCKMLSTKDNIISVEVSEKDGSGVRILDVKMVDSDHLRITEAATKREVALKRMK